MNVGTAVLRNRLSYFLRQVRTGAHVTITDHGEPIAQIVPLPRGNDLKGRIAAMVREGTVTAPQVRSRAAVRPIKLRGRGLSASDMVSEMRDER